MDPAKQRGMNEKITDKARGMFEKATGYESFFGPFFHLFVGVAVVCIGSGVVLCLLLVWLVASC